MKTDKLEITPLFDDATNTSTYSVADPDTSSSAVIDPMLDYDISAERTPMRCRQT